MKYSSWLRRVAARAKNTCDTAEPVASPGAEKLPENGRSPVARVEMLEGRILYSADVLGLVPEPEERVGEVLKQSAGDSNVATVSAPAAPLPHIPAAEVDRVSHAGLFGGSADSAIEPLSLDGVVAAINPLLLADEPLATATAPGNDPPSLTGFPADYPVYTETGPAVLLVPDIVVSDPELDAVDNYNGFTVYVARTNSPGVNDQFDLGAYGAGTKIVDGGVTIGEQLQNGNGVLELQFDTAVSRQTVQDVLRAIGYFNTEVTDEHRQVYFTWTINDHNNGSQGTGGPGTARYATALNIVPSYLVAEDDLLATMAAGTTNSIAQNELLNNDTGVLAPTAQVVDVSVPSQGSLSNSLEYTSAPADTGQVSFDYTAMAGNATLISQWNLSTDGTDDLGNNSGVTYTDSVGELVFDGDDYIELPNIVYPDTFALTFDFKIDNLTNDREEAFFAHGEYRGKNSLLVWATGTEYTDEFDRGKLWTYIRDSNDADDTFGFGIDITGLDQSIWHTYTIVVEKGVGAKVWINDVQHIDAPRSGGDFQPDVPAYIGAEMDSGTLNYFLANYQMADLRLLDGYDGTLNQFSTATATFDLRNEEVVEESSFSIAEDVTRPISNTELLTTDVDSAAADLEYELINDAMYGKLLLNDTELNVGDTFTQRNVNQGELSFRHGGDEFATADTMALTVDDGEGDYSDVDLQITLQPVNDAPVFVADGSLGSVDEGTVEPAGESIENIFTGSFSDAETPIASLPFDGIAVASNADVSHGDWQYRVNGASDWTNIGDSVSEAAALMLKRTAYLRFVPDENYHGSAPALQVYAVDATYSGDYTSTLAAESDNVTMRGGSTPFSADAANIQFTVNSVNDAPVLGDATMAAIDEDDTDSAGDTIANIFSGQFSDVDSGSSFAGIAVSANVSSASGNWQYSTDSGGRWYGFEPVATTQAVLLDTSAMLRFVPATNFNGSATPLEVYAVDDTIAAPFTSGGLQRTIDASDNGDGTPVSAASASVLIEVNPVFDPPFFTGVQPSLVSVNEDEDSVIDLSGLTVEPGDWSGSVALHLFTSGAGHITAPDQDSNPRTNDELFISAVSTAGINNFLSNQTVTYRHLTEHADGDAADMFSYRLMYNSGADSTPVNSVDINIASVNDRPELQGYDNAVFIFTTTEDTLTTLTLDDIDASSLDVEDGTLHGIVVQPDTDPGVDNGSLWIGLNAGEAQQWAAGSNDTIDSNNHAFWLPPENRNGVVLAFSIKGIDSEGLLSSDTAIVKGNVTPVNDAPTLNENTVPYPTADEDSLVRLTLTELIDLTSADDVEDDIDEMVIGSVPAEHTLYIGADSTSWNEFLAGVHDTVNATDHVFWQPEQNLAGSGIEAFSVTAKDGQGLQADAPVKVYLDLTVVNDPPTIESNTAPLPTIVEDNTAEFTLTELVGYLQGDDIENEIAEFVVESVPDGHELWIGPNRGEARQFEAGVDDTIDDSNRVWWTPQSNFNGETIAFTVTAKDDDGLASVDSADFSLSITPVNDAPVIASNTATLATPLPTVAEDNTAEFTLAELVTYLQGSDVENEIAELVVESVPDGHELWIGPNRGEARQFEAGIDDTVDDSSRVWWTPESNFNGETIAFTVTAKDNDGLASVGSADFSLLVTPVNDAPVIVSNTATLATPLPTVAEDNTAEFTLTELVTYLQGSDVENEIAELVVESVPDGHELWIGPNRGEARQFEAGVDDTIDDSNRVWWTPESNFNGETIAFTVTAKDNDGLASVDIADFSLSVTPVNDAPVIASNTATLATPLPTVAEDNTGEFTLTELVGYLQGSDVENEIAELVVESVPDGHELWIGPNRGEARQFDTGVDDTIDDSNRVWWTPQSNFNGETIAFTVTARDNDGLASVGSADFSLSVTPVNDAPTAINSTLSVEAATVYSLQPEDFGFDDPVESHALQAVQISSLPEDGQLLYLETPVSVGDEISLSSLIAGELQYVSPDSDGTDPQIATLQFRVKDAGGTGNGGEDLSTAAAVLRFNIMQTDAPPVVEVVEELPFVVNENSPSGTVIGRLAAIDPDPVFSHLHDGSFETGIDLAPDVNRYSIDGAWGGSNIGYWDVVSGNVDLRGSLWETGPDGGHPLDLNGSMPGAIAQQIATKPGAPYTLEFALAGNFRDGSDSVALEVQIGTQTYQYTVDKATDWTERNLNWQQQSVRFIAEDPATTITFRTQEAGQYGPVVTDIEVYDELAFEVVDASLPFAISSDNTLVTTGDELDYESADSYAIDVRISELDGLATVVSYPVEVTDLNESPSLQSNELLQTIVGNNSVIGQDKLSATDVDESDQRADALVYTITAVPANGVLLLGGTPLANGDSISQDDIDQQRLSYQGSVSGTDQFSFKLQDGGEDGAGPVNDVFVIDVYEPLQLQVNSLWHMSEAASMQMSAAHVDTIGGFYDDGNLLVEIVSQPDTVAFFHAGAEAPVTAFAMDQLHRGDITLQHDGSEPDGTLQSVELSLTRIDGDQTEFAGSVQVDLQVDDVANPPVGGDSEMATDHKTPLTVTIEQLAFDDLEDGDTLKAIQIEQVPESGSVLNAGQVLAAGDTVTAEAIEQGQLVYQPNPQMVGTVTDTIEFRLIDSGDRATGGENVSVDANTIEVHVTSDHPPVAIADVIVVDEGGVVSILESGNQSVLANDEDPDTQVEDLRAILLNAPLHGDLQLQQDGTFSYQHDRSETVTDRFSYRVLDTSTNTSTDEDSNQGTQADTTAVADETDIAWVEIRINPLNDSPVAGVAEDQSVIAGAYFEFVLPHDLFRAYYPDHDLSIAADLTDGADLPDWLRFDEATGTFSGVANLNQFDALDIRLTATDPDNATAAVTFKLTIEPPLGAATAVESPVQDRPAAPVEVVDNDVKPATVSEEQNASARQSTLDNIGATDGATDNDPPESAALVDSEELIVFAETKIEHKDLVEFEDKIIKHIDKAIVAESIEQVAIVVDSLDTVALQQLYFSNDDFKVAVARKVIDQLDRNRDELSAAVEQNKIVFSGAATVSVGLSISYILWLLKSGMLLSSALSAMPAWRLIDPVPVLQDYGSDGDGEDESLESLVEESPEDEVDDDEQKDNDGSDAGLNTEESDTTGSNAAVSK